MSKEKIVLHLCCAVCGAYLADWLKRNFSEVLLYFYNPNIQPQEEYQKRKASAEKLAEILNLELKEGDYQPQNWLLLVKGLEKEPEGGRRCQICFRERLRATAQLAKNQNFSCFTTTLLLSPFKDEKTIINLGREIAQEFGLSFFNPFDLVGRKEEIWQKSRALAKQYNFYHQNYCGCLFSLKKKISYPQDLS